MEQFHTRLLKYKFLIITLCLALLAFVILYLGETYFSLSPRTADIFRSIAAAFLTSGVVGFVFEYLTRQEFSEVIHAAVAQEIEKMERRRWNQSENGGGLEAFWRPFVTIPTAIVVAQDDSGEPFVRAADLSAALALYKGLMAHFVRPGDHEVLEFEFISKYRPLQNNLHYDKNLIIIAAPGANPLATLILASTHGFSEIPATIQDGYVFAVENKPATPYLKNPYVISAGENPPGIWELRGGVPIRRYERNITTIGDALGCDCCLIVRAEFAGAQGKKLQVIIIAGHSRYATMDGVNFVLTNNEWATLVNQAGAPNTETILTTTTSIAHGRVVKAAQTPRPIARSRGRISNEAGR